MKQIPYIRVGTSYYKQVKAPTIARHFNEILVRWNMETIKQDHGKDHLLIVRLISSYEFSRQHTERAYDENIFSLEVYPFFFCS